MKIKEVVPSIVTGIQGCTHEMMLSEIASMKNNEAEQHIDVIRNRVEQTTGRNVTPYMEQQVLTEIVSALHGVNNPGSNLLRYHCQKRILFLHNQAVQNGR